MTTPVNQNQYPAQVQQLVDAQGRPVQTVIVNTVPNSSGTYENYQAKTSVALGWLQIAAGIMSIICTVVGIVVATMGSFMPGNFTFYIGYGIWCAIFYLIAGSFAVVAGRRKGTCAVVTSLVMCIISAVFSWLQIGFAASSIAMESSYTRYYYYGYEDGHDRKSKQSALLAMSVFLLIGGLLGFVTAVWTSSLGCRVTCCGTGSSAPHPQVMYMNAPTQGQQPMAFPYTYQSCPIPTQQATANPPPPQWSQPAATEAKETMNAGESTPPPAYSMAPTDGGYTNPGLQVASGLATARDDKRQLINEA